MAIFSGIATAISGLLAGTFLSGAVGSFILKAVVGVGLNLLASSLAGGEQEKPQFSVQGQLQTGGDVARSFPIGWTATAGSLVYANTWGKAGKTPNAYFTQVIALSDIPIGGLGRPWINGEKCTIDYDDTSYGDWGFPVKEYKKGNDNALWVKFYDGTQTAADPFLVNEVSSAGRPYEATRVGVGVAYVIVTAQIREDRFTGFPNFKFEIHGAKLYDPSKDSSVGGAGPQRWTNRSTWGGDGDHLPAVQLYNVLRGITFQGTWLYGLQNMPAARLPAADWIAEIAKCRATVGGPGGTEPTYRCGGEIQVGAQTSEAVKTILTSCQGRLSEAGGIYKMHIGASGAATYGITDADILSTEEQTFTPFFGLADTINGITATYPSPAEGWNAKVAPPRHSPQNEAEDGNRRLLADVPLDFVPYKGQVQRLMKSALAEARRARRHTFVLPPKYWPLEAGDFISWTSARNGYVTKKFRVDGVIDKENLDIVVDMTEVDPSDYDWDQDTDFRTEPDGKIDRGTPTPQPIVDWFAEPAVIADATGAPRRPAIKLSWDNSADQIVDVDAVSFAVRLRATGEIIYRGRTDAVADGAILISQNLLPGMPYQVRGKYVPGSARETLWSSWLDVTTDNIRFGDDDVYLPGMVEGLQELVDDATEFSRDGVRPLIDEVTKIAQLAAEQDARNYTDRKELLRELRSTTGTITAAYKEAIAVATSPGSALVQQLETAEIEIGKRATVNAVAALKLQTDETKAGLTTLAGQLDEFTIELHGKASASALQGLTSTVSQQGNQISLQGSSITSIRNTLNGKASTESVALLDGRIDDIDGTISAISNALISVSAASGGNVAAANLRMRATAGPAGYASRIMMEARAGGAGSWRSAAIILDVPSNPAVPTRAVLLADQVAFADGPSVKYPLVFQDGILRLRDIVLRNADIDHLTVDWAQIKNAKVTSAQIDRLTVKESNIDFNAITSWTKGTTGGLKKVTGDVGDWVTLDTFTLYNPNPNPVLINIAQTLRIDRPTSTQGTSVVSLRLVRGSTIVHAVSMVLQSPGSKSDSDNIFLFDMDTGWNGGTRTYKILASRGGIGTHSVSMVANMLVWKR